MSHKAETQFPNFWSRLLIKRWFDLQFIVPGEPPKFVEALFKLYERRMMSIDIDSITVDRPIFLVGLPRTGTSMLQDILCTHSETGFITNMMNQFQSCFCAAETLRKKLRLDVKGERFVGDSVEVEAGSPNEGFSFWGLWLDWSPESHEYTPRSIDSFSKEEVNAIHEDLRKILWCFEGRAKRFFSKNPALLPDVPLLKDLFPDARFVHIVRDPRPVANSLIKLLRTNRSQLAKIAEQTGQSIFDPEEFVPYPRLPSLASILKDFPADDVRATARLWNDAICFMEEQQPTLPHFYQVRYEDILENPQDEIFKVMDFCELSRPDTSDSKFWDKLNKVGVIRHKNQYSDYEVIQDICQPHMQRLGYA